MKDSMRVVLSQKNGNSDCAYDTHTFLQLFAG